MAKKKSVPQFVYEVRSVKSGISTFSDLEKIIDKTVKHLESKEIAKTHYIELKAKLRAILKPSETMKGLASLNDVERNFVVPACSEALGRLTSPVNSHPIKSDWHSQLYSAKADIIFFRRQLDNILSELVKNA